TIALGTTINNINFNLDSPGSISGKVTDRTGAPLADLTVNLYNSFHNKLSSAKTNTSGDYVFTSLTAGNYQVETGTDFGYMRQIYNGPNCTLVCSSGGAATMVPVSYGTATSHIDFSIGKAGRISGAYVDTEGKPIIADIILADSSGQILRYLVPSGGTYTTQDLPP